MKKEPNYSSLTIEEKNIVLEREKKKMARENLYLQINQTEDPDIHEHIFNQLRNLDSFECEHGRSITKHCLACGAIDHKLWPELYDEDGLPIASAHLIGDDISNDGGG